MSTKLNTWSIKLLVSNTFFRWARILVQIFLSIYVWKVTNDIKVIALFNIVLNSFQAIWFFIGAFFVKAGHRNIINYIAFTLVIVLYICIALLSEYIVESIYIIWAILWTWVGLYYINYDLNQFDLSHFKNRWNLEWIKKSLKITIKIIFPIIFWFIISYYNIELAFVVAIVCLFGWMYYGRIDFQPSTGKVNIWAFLKILQKNRRLVFSLLWCLFLAFSFSATIVDTLLSIILFEKLWTEMKLWFSLSIISAISIVIVYMFWRFVQYRHYNIWFIVFTILYIISLLGFLYADSYTTVLLLSSCVLSVILLYQVMASVLNSNSLHSVENIDDYKVEFYIFRELAYTTGWTIGFGLMYFAWDLSQGSLKIIFYTMMWFSIITTSLLMRVNIHEIEQ